MIEKIKSINNPLTIIAIFATLAEIAGTVALATVAPELQGIFIWFVMLFPTLLVVCFFVTLNFNPRVLYAPSDFKNEEHFVDIVAGSRHLTDSLKYLKTDLSNFKEQLKKEILSEDMGQSNEKMMKLSELFDSKLNELSSKIEESRMSAEELSSDITFDLFSRKGLQIAILSVLAMIRKPATAGDIAKALKINETYMLSTLDRLQRLGFIESVAVDKPYREGTTMGYQLVKNRKIRKTLQNAATDAD